MMGTKPSHQQCEFWEMESTVQMAASVFVHCLVFSNHTVYSKNKQLAVLSIKWLKIGKRFKQIMS